MKDELGTSVHRSSLEAYSAMMHKPSRAPYFVVAALAIVALMYTVDALRDMWFAHACAQVRDTWTGKECKPREETPPPAQHYTLELPPIKPDSDIPTPPPVPTGTVPPL